MVFLFFSTWYSVRTYANGMCAIWLALQISNHLELIKPNPRDEPDKQKDAEFAAAVFGSDIDMVGGNTQNESFMGLSDVKHCGKMRALEKLMLSWISQGDKILLFSYSVRYLLNLLYQET